MRFLADDEIHQTAYYQHQVIKQFVVANYIEEQPGSVVNGSLKNGILILIDASKELDFYADFKYISFIKFSLTNQKIRA